jgi:hypothetical protein
MSYRPDSNGIYSLEKLPWSWSYLHRPRVLALWLGCAVIGAFLSSGKSHGRRGVPTAQAAPQPAGRVLALQGQPAREPRRDDRDDEARAA